MRTTFVGLLWDEINQSPISNLVEKILLFWAKLKVATSISLKFNF